MVNNQTVFKGEIKSGSRGANRKAGRDPELDVYVNGEVLVGKEKLPTDFKIRLLGHWGSTVHFRKVKIKAVGSIPPKKK